MNLIHEQLKRELQSYIKTDISFTKVPESAPGDICFPCFIEAKELKKNPVEVARDLAQNIKSTNLIEYVKAVGPYVNIFLHLPQVANIVLPEINKQGKDFGKEGSINKTLVIDYSSPNIAKPFGIGHLRTTMIGHSLVQLYRSKGWNVIGVNHLGDWGTQFGKLIVAWKKWGGDKDPNVKYLFDLYVKFHKEAETNKELDDEGRAWFKKLEDGDKEAWDLWDLFRNISIKDFQKTYDLLGIEFEETSGEAFYMEQLEPTIDLFKGVSEISNGALIVDLGKITPLMLRKSDGATTYATRDLAAALYRLDKYKADKLLYVVGEPQKLHFKQMFAALNKIGINKDMVHVDFGHMNFPEGKMSTRKGNIIFLEKVLDKSIELVKAVIEEKNPNLPNKKEVAKMVGVGAIVFEDLKNDRIRNMLFSWEKALDFDGESGPYLQYTHARACSILRKSGDDITASVSNESYSHDSEKQLILHLSAFSDAISEAVNANKPHIMARYLLDLAQKFNEFYHSCPVICNVHQLQSARLLLVDSSRVVLENGLKLLGLKAPKEM